MLKALDTIPLRDGSSVRVRPIRPDDKEELRRALGRLSDESVQRRFLSPKPALSASELRYLTELDGHDHVALVAEPLDRPGMIVAVGRFVRLPADPETADIAIVVGDALQGQGLGTRLGELLTDEARAHGIRRFSATMLGDNVAAHRLMDKLSDRLERSSSHGAAEVLAELAA
jgi:acetyltransferase